MSALVFSSILKVFDKIIDILKYREEKRERKLYLILPEFIGYMDEVHKDYLDVLSTAKNSLEAAVQDGIQADTQKEALIEVANYVRQREADRLRERRSCQELASLLGSSPAIPDDCRLLFQLSARYFESGAFSEEFSDQFRDSRR